MGDVTVEFRHQRRPKIAANDVKKIVCNRVNDFGEEEYLVRWKRGDTTQAVPYSWHILPELRLCLYNLQKYIDKKRGSKRNKPLISPTLKRKTPDDEDSDCIILPSFNVETSYRNHKSANNVIPPQELNQTLESRDYTVYNGRLIINDGWIKMNPNGVTNDEHIKNDLPTAAMEVVAERVSTQKAEKLIRVTFERELGKLSGPRVNLVNTFNSKIPPLNLKFIDDYILREGVQRSDPATIVGCQNCKPNMGQSKGCQYTRKCECLEYAAVEKGRLTEEEGKLLKKIEQKGYGDTSGLPKRFPYFCTGTRAECLVPFYLESSHVIYECNLNCPCGPQCKTRVVQKGRTVPLTIFKTADRGWGLRCPEDLNEGQFIDTYRGEIITNTESIRREKVREGHLSSYLYALDKFDEELKDSQSEAYVIDGRENCGVTRFVNHSCEPNCYQFAVSYNKHDFRIYDIAFFAATDIKANEELTFDYTNNCGANADEDENDILMEDADKDVEGRTKCRCGTKSCRGWLWNKL